MDKLQQYLDEAEDFLLEKKSEITKQNIIWFCKKHGLDQKFEKRVHIQKLIILII